MLELLRVQGRLLFRVAARCCVCAYHGPKVEFRDVRGRFACMSRDREVGILIFEYGSETELNCFETAPKWPHIDVKVSSDLVCPSRDILLQVPEAHAIVFEVGMDHMGDDVRVKGEFPKA